MSARQLQDWSGVFSRLTSFLAGWRNVLNPRFRSIRDTRDPEKVLYDRETVVWAALAGMFLRKASRNRMDCDRNKGRLAESALRLSGQGVDDWPDGEELTVPCSETCCNLFRHGGTAQLQRALAVMVAHLVRNKSLECAKFSRYVAVAVDGVEQELLPAHAACEQPLAGLQRLRHSEAREGMPEDGPVGVGGAALQGIPRDRHHG